MYSYEVQELYPHTYHYSVLVPIDFLRKSQEGDPFFEAVTHYLWQQSSALEDKTDLPEEVLYSHPPLELVLDLPQLYTPYRSWSKDEDQEAAPHIVQVRYVSKSW
jgi:hypothetical protein